MYSEAAQSEVAGQSHRHKIIEETGLHSVFTLTPRKLQFRVGW